MILWPPLSFVTRGKVPNPGFNLVRFYMLIDGFLKFCFKSAGDLTEWYCIRAIAVGTVYLKKVYILPIEVNAFAIDAVREARP